MSKHAILLVAPLLLASAGAQITTPSVENPLYPGREVTAAQVNNPTLTDSDGSVPNGANADQVFSVTPDGFSPIAVGADNNKPVVSLGRKLKLASVELTGDGTEVGADGVGVENTASGHGESTGDLTTIPDTHVMPHEDQVSVTGGGKTLSTGVGVNPDNTGGEGPPLVYTTPGRK